MKSTNRFSYEGRLLRRRSFLQISGLIGLGAASLTDRATAEVLKFDRKNYKVSKTRLAMGTIVSMTLIHPSKDQAEEAMALAFEEIDRLSNLMNRFKNTTAISSLNKEGRMEDAPPEVQYVVERALFYHKVTGGAFDITVKPVVDLFQAKYEKKQPLEPTEAELSELLRLVDAAKVEIAGRSISFRTPGMGITLDGIAKGYIVDKASEVLARNQISNHLIAGGGDIRTMGEKAEHQPWTIAVQDPWKKGNYPDLIHLSGGGVSTSGNYEVYYDEEKMFHHIVNPRTGFSPTLTSSATITASTTMEADALATGVFVMGPEKGTEFVDSLPRCASLIIDRKGAVVRSRAWKSAAA